MLEREGILEAVEAIVPRDVLAEKIVHAHTDITTLLTSPQKTENTTTSSDNTQNSEHSSVRFLHGLFTEK